MDVPSIQAPFKKGLSKKTQIIAVVVAVLIIFIIAGIFFFYKLKNSGYNFDSSIFDKINEGATKGVLPSINTNALENKPDVNPVDAANPIKNIKTNPF